MNPQPAFPRTAWAGWPDGKRCAVTLTFDDARVSQLTHGLPLLDACGAKATFFLLPTPAHERLAAWQHAAEAGHEIGNHTLTHPCSGNYRFARGNALEEYTLDRIAEEIDGAQSALGAMFRREPAVFAYPCGESFVGRGRQRMSFVPLVAERFHAGRGAHGEDHNDPAVCDLAHVLSMNMDGVPLQELMSRVERCVGEGGWLVLTGHEVGAAGRYSVDTGVLGEFCRELTARDGLWLATLGEAGNWVRRARGE